jgi:hypothetical protein
MKEKKNRCKNDEAEEFKTQNEEKYKKREQGVSSEMARNCLKILGRSFF